MITDQKIKEVVNKCYYMSEVLRYFNIPLQRNKYRWLHSKIKELNIDISHFKSYKNIITKMAEVNLNTLLIKDSNFLDSNRLKKKIFKANLLEKKCNECGIVEWDNKQISLQIDHINGIPSDNTLENLRILCPNCHWQLGHKKSPDKKGRKKLLKMKSNK